MDEASKTNTLPAILFAVFVALSSLAAAAADAHQPAPRVDGAQVRKPSSSASSTLQTSAESTDDLTKRQPLQRLQQQKFGRGTASQSIDVGDLETASALGDRRLGAVKKGDADRRAGDRVGGASTAALKAPSIGSVGTKASNRTQQPPIVVAISVLSRRLKDKDNGTSLSAITGNSVNDNMKKIHWKPQTLQPAKSLSLATPPTTVASTTISQNVWANTSALSMASQQQQQQLQHHDIQRQSTMVAAGADAHINDGTNAKTATDSRPAANSVEMNFQPAHLNVSDLSLSVVPESPPYSSLFSMVDVDDEVDPNERDDGDWKTVAELLREVGHQLTGLRSFIRHLRTDNAAVYRDIIQTALRMNRERALSSSAGRCDDVDDADDVREDDEEEDEEELRPLRSTPHLPQVSENNENRKWFRSGTHQNIVETRRHRHGHGSADRGDVTDRDTCPADFQRVSTSICYRLVTERVTWSVARERCASIGARLATIRSAAEQRHLVELARKKYDTAHCDIWIGLTRLKHHHPPKHLPLHRRQSANRRRSKRRWTPTVRQPSSRTTTSDQQSHRLQPRFGWYWVDTPLSDKHVSGHATPSSSMPTYTNWNKGEPNNAGDNQGDDGEQCVEALWVFGWKWNDARCHGPSTACYVCQAAAMTADDDGDAVRSPLW